MGKGKVWMIPYQDRPHDEEFAELRHFEKLLYGGSGVHTGI